MADSSSQIDSTAWRKSSYSGGTTANCVEVGNTLGGIVVRDSKSPENPALRFDRIAWTKFLTRL